MRAARLVRVDDDGRGTITLRAGVASISLRPHEADELARDLGLVAESYLHLPPDEATVDLTEAPVAPRERCLLPVTPGAAAGSWECPTHGATGAVKHASDPHGYRCGRRVTA